MANKTDPFWIGQKKINGNLCRVDWLILEALKEASSLLAAKGAAVATLDEMIIKADKVSANVALENPPGCVPSERNLEGGG